MKNILITIFASIIGLGVLYWAFAPTPVPVDLSTVWRGPMEVSIKGEGQTRVHDIYTVSAPVSGRIQRVEVHAGDAVIAGQTLLATIEPASPQFLDARAQAQGQASVKAAEAANTLAQAELNRVQAELTYATSTLKRSRKLYDNQTISELAFDQAKLAGATATAAVNSAQATLLVRQFELETAIASLIDPASKQVQDATCCIDVLAPVSGRVLRVLRQSEGVVERASPLIELGDPDHLEVVVDLLSSDAVRVREGNIVVFRGWGKDTPLNGQVSRIEPYGFTKVSALGIEEQRVNIIINFTGAASNWAALGHGFRVVAEIREWYKDDILQIPIGSLFRDGDNWAVFVDDDGSAKLTTITVGHINGRSAEVISGLREDDKVISHPSDRVNDGVNIVVRHLEPNIR